MHKDIFSLDGVSCEEYGIVLRGPIEFGGRSPNVSTVKIPGRNGVLHIYDGSYGNVKGKAKCFILDENGAESLYRAIAWLSKPGYRRLEVNESEYFRLAAISDGPDEAIRMGLLAPFTIAFDCDPRIFMKSGENPVVMDNGGTISNPGMSTKPLIEITGNGAGTISLNGTVIEIKSMNASLTIDCETQNAYKGLENKNNTINAPVFPELKTGDNGISWDGGITGVTITPRWWV